MLRRLAIVFAVTAAAGATSDPSIAASAATLAASRDGGDAVSRVFGHHGGTALRSGAASRSGGLGLRSGSGLGDTNRSGFTGHQSSGWYQRGWGGTLNPGWGYNFGPNLGGSSH
jgi:hypothetical protein